MHWASRNKFHARKVTVGSDTFDSRLEYRRWLELRDMECRQQIHGLQRQVEFALIDPRPADGRNTAERGAQYTADFVYHIGDNIHIAEDVKSTATRKLPDYILRRKLFKQRHGDFWTFVEVDSRKIKQHT